MKELCIFLLLVCWNSLVHQAKIGCLNTSLGLLDVLVHAGQVLANPINHAEKALSGQSFQSLLWQGAKYQTHHYTYLRWFFVLLEGMWNDACFYEKFSHSLPKDKKPSAQSRVIKGTKVELRQELNVLLFPPW